MSLSFTPTPLSGALVIEATAFADERGAFSRVFSIAEFAQNGLETGWRQTSFSQNTQKGTLRGLHFQRPPHAETKLVRCERGRIFDVLVDLRDKSPTFGGWFGTELTGNDSKSLYIPQGFAHGFVTLEDDSVVGYHISVDYKAEAADGLRWDDPDIAIDWPIEPGVISDRDRALPLLSTYDHSPFSAE